MSNCLVHVEVNFWLDNGLLLDCKVGEFVIVSIRRNANLYDIHLMV